MQIRSIVTLIVTFLYFSQACYPQSQPVYNYDRIMETSTGVFQSARLKIIISYSAPAGIFVALSDQPIGLQSFDIQDLKAKNTLTAFIEYDIEQDKYTKLYIGKKRYQVRGNFTFVMNDVRVGIDNANTYLSVTLGSGLIGIRGLERVIDSIGEQNVIAEANEYGDYYNIAPYVITKNKLFLRGKEVKTSSLIGLSIEQPKNICLSEEVLFLPQERISEIRSAKSKQKRVALLQKSLKENTGKLFLNKSLMLRVKKEFLVALDYLDGVLFEVKPIQSRFANRTVCVVKRMTL